VDAHGDRGRHHSRQAHARRCFCVGQDRRVRGRSARALLGYERGAFTGAQQMKPGQIELATGGVLFLDEVSEMSQSAHAKFLRVLQERCSSIWAGRGPIAGMTFRCSPRRS
jgi:transcriptional regulator of acetoin/glycerol metabolism